MKKRSSFDRRRFLQTTGIAGLSLAMPRFLPAETGQGISDHYNGLKSDNFLGQVRVETRINDDSIFTEGPAVDRAGNVYFTNIPMNKILNWHAGQKQLLVFSTTSNAANVGIQHKPTPIGSTQMHTLRNGAYGEWRDEMPLWMIALIVFAVLAVTIRQMEER